MTFHRIKYAHLSAELIKALDDLSSDRGLKIGFDNRGVWLNFKFQWGKNIHSYQRCNECSFAFRNHLLT